MNTKSQELIFEVTAESDGYVAECLTENIITQGDTWEELREMVKDAVTSYFFDGVKPQSVRLRLVRDETFSLQ